MSEAPPRVPLSTPPCSHRRWTDANATAAWPSRRSRASAAPALVRGTIPAAAASGAARREAAFQAHRRWRRALFAPAAGASSAMTATTQGLQTTGSGLRGESRACGARGASGDMAAIELSS
eukprot:365976-Chlamydomonas_euryale.AAC.3